MRKGKILHKAFVIGIVFKGIDGVLEIIGGLALLLIPSQSLNNWFWSMIQHELSKAPGDFIANILVNWAQHWSVASISFIAVYMLAHGVIKSVIAAFLLKRKIWAYHIGIAFFILFIVYQLYRYTHTRSAWLIALSVFDALLIYLTWNEYRRVRASGLFEDRRQG